MSADTFVGGCFCGAVRIGAAGPVRSCCICHCESCRKASGGAFVAWATFDKTSFRITAGELALHASSPEATRGHCAICGTSLTYEHLKRPNEVDISLAGFDDPDRFSPTSHIWIEDKLPWVIVSDGLPQHRSWASADTD